MKRTLVLLMFIGLVVGMTHAESQMAFFTKTTELTTVAFAEHQGPYEEIPTVIKKLSKWVSDHDYTLVGPPAGVYFNDPREVSPDELQWLIEWPIADAVEKKPAVDGIGIKIAEPTLVAVTYHKGPYEKVGETYGALFGWIAQNGYEMAGAPREIFWSDPAETAAEKLVTEVQIPVTVKKK